MVLSALSLAALGLRGLPLGRLGLPCQMEGAQPSEVDDFLREENRAPLAEFCVPPRLHDAPLDLQQPKTAAQGNAACLSSSQVSPENSPAAANGGTSRGTSSQPKTNEKNVLRITNVPVHISVAKIRSQFSQYGKIKSIEFTFSRKSRGCAVIRCGDPTHTLSMVLFCRRICACLCRALKAIHVGVDRYANAEMCTAAKHQISLANAASKAKRSASTGVGTAAPEHASGSAERQVAGIVRPPVAPALAPPSNSKKRRVPGSGQRGASARARSEAGAGTASEAAAHTTRPRGGGESGWEASTSGSWSEGSLSEPTAPGPLAMGGMTAISAMAKLAPQILQSAGV